jgi:hypothetical protein
VRSVVKVDVLYIGLEMDWMDGKGLTNQSHGMRRGDGAISEPIGKSPF